MRSLRCVDVIALAALLMVVVFLPTDRVGDWYRRTDDACTLPSLTERQILDRDLFGYIPRVCPIWRVYQPLEYKIRLGAIGVQGAYDSEVYYFRPIYWLFACEVALIALIWRTYRNRYTSRVRYD
jgi:hypothetical protein